MNLETFLDLPSNEAFSYAGEQLKKKHWTWKHYQEAMREWNKKWEERRLEEIKKVFDD